MSVDTQTNEKQYNISDEELQRIHEIQKEMIREIDRICRKNHIHYNMVGGTMLGAIRHGGYIPWDDDVDIGFLRNEYEKFRKVCKEDLDHSRFYIQDCRDTNGYRWGYGKFRRKDSEFIRLNQEYMPYEQGLFIDLMPFDNIPDGWVARRIHFAMCFLFRKFFWSEVGSRTEKNKGIRLLYSIMRLVPHKTLIKLFEGFIERGKRLGKTELVRILTFPTPKGVFGYERKWYTDLTGYKFDELTLPGAKDYDGYLKVKYGHYMELPPVEKRKIHPISKLRLPELQSLLLTGEGGSAKR